MKALEAYAAQVQEADDRYAELTQLKQLTGDSDEILGFLARTVRDGLAAEGIQRLTGEAAVVAHSFTEALELARQHTILALPADGAS